ncbi:MAG: energy-coupled thiamine transporter ThiT [Clostridiales bacterium]|nr:energy-coupled thiamine transporter ThiT [Clostridiales bacterium]
MNNSKTFSRSDKIRTLVECAVLIAIGMVLSFVVIWEMPLGGSVTLLSMLPICLIGFRHGAKWGFGSAFVYSLFQLLTSKVFAWGLTPLVLVVCILADYIVAFTLLGVTGFFKEKGEKGVIIGTSVAMVLRFICHYISGVTIWASSAPEGWNPWIYSAAYNGAYMLPELIFTIIATAIIVKIPAYQKTLK